MSLRESGRTMIKDVSVYKDFHDAFGGVQKVCFPYGIPIIPAVCHSLHQGMECVSNVPIVGIVRIMILMILIIFIWSAQNGQICILLISIFHYFAKGVESQK